MENFNRKPVSVRKGKVYLDGVEVMDGVSCKINFTPEVWNGKQLNDNTESARWLGYKITGEISRYRCTNWMRETVMKYLNDGITPEFTIQGVMNDAGSDYYQANGTEIITAVGCVLTGDISLLTLDSNGDVLTDTLSFSAAGIV